MSKSSFSTIKAKNITQAKTMSSNVIELQKYIAGYRFTQLLYVAAELKIPDLLTEGTRTVKSLSNQTNCHEESLYRVLRALTTIGCFKETSEGFENTELSLLLSSDHPNSLRPLAIMRGEEVNWKPWGELLYGVQTGNSPFEKAFDMNLFDYYETHPKSGETFNQGMRITTEPDIESILNKMDFSKFNSIVEVGGGLGHLIFAILAENPGLKGVLFDLPHVIRDAYDLRKKHGVDDRCEIIGGHFFDSVPAGGDLYIMKRILHDWGDEECTQILQKCRDAMPDAGRLIVFDSMVKDDFISPDGKVVDVHMMVVCPGGKERTQDQFSSIFEKAGFSLGETIEIRTGLFAIEGTPN